MFVVAVRGARNWRCAEALCPFQQGLQWNPAPRREAGQGTPAKSLCSTDDGIDREDRHTLIASAGGPNSEESFMMLGVERTPAVMTPIIPIDMRQASRGGTITNNRAHGSGGAPGHGVGEPDDPGFTVSERGQAVAICEGAHGVTEMDVATAVQQGGGKPGQGYQAIAFETHGASGSRNAGIAKPGDPSLALNAQVRQGVATGMSVRRLTPVECERLQGFPDNWTAITWRGKPAADGNRYRALGNSMAVPCVKWILMRLRDVPRQG